MATKHEFTCEGNSIITQPIGLTGLQPVAGRSFPDPTNGTQSLSLNFFNCAIQIEVNYSKSFPPLRNRNSLIIIYGPYTMDLLINF